jgi:micrococcal nuclease
VSARARGRPGIGALALLGVALFLLLHGCDGDGDGPAGPPDAPSRDSARAEVLRVVDGDTIEVSLEGTEEDVRYIGVDTPESVAPGEPVECFGHRASDLNADLVDGRTVRLAFDRELRDDYGRLLAYVHVGGVFVNAELVERGYARTLEIPPNTARAPLLARLEREAGEAGRGLWNACAP